MKIIYFWRAFFIALFIIFVGQNAAAFPPYLNYQGKLTDLNGNALDGTYNMQFLLYNAQTGGIPMWTEPQSVIVENGIYNVQLGIYTTLSASLFDESSLYLEVKIYNGDTSQWETFDPRQELTAAAFAMKADNSSTLQGKPASEFAASTHLHGAADITSGVLSDARIPAGIARDSEITWNNLSGIPAGFSDGIDDVGIGVETDPTVTASVKDGVAWAEVTDKPAGFADNMDDVGLTSETDPQVGDNTLNRVPKWNGTALVTGTLFDNGNIGIGIQSPEMKLDVNGDAKFNLGTGSIAITTPGGWPGVTSYAPNGHRRDIQFYNDYTSIALSNSASASNPLNGIQINENGNVGIGTLSPETKLHVNGSGMFNVGGGSIAVTTPGGWPGMIAYSPNGHRRDVHFYNDQISITLSDSASPSPNTNGIRIYENGNVAVKVLQITGGSDLSEEFDVRPGKEDLLPSPGMVVSIDPENPGDLIISNKPYDRMVAGIISGAGGVKPGMLMGQKGSEADGSNHVALTGRVYCRADASKGKISPGDLLTTSETAGHAMKVTNYARAQGAILGKAMSSLESGRGLVLVLVTLQ